MKDNVKKETIEKSEKKRKDSAKEKDVKKNVQHIEKLVPDTSVIIEGVVSKKIELGELQPECIVIHEAILAELEHQANLNRATGLIGLDEIKKIAQLSETYNYTIEFSGRRPSGGEIKHAKIGEIDALIRELAYELDATLITADKVQAKVAEAKRMKFILIEIVLKQRKLKLDDFFTPTTMSVHLRESNYPFAKIGQPGKWDFVKVKETLLTHEELKDLSKEIIEETNSRKDGFIEIERAGSTIIQLGKYRIVITRPPFSDAWEITAVRPVKKLQLSDYNLPEKLQRRVEEQAEGILIAGAPGQGKSTFAQALAEFYDKKNKIVKTVEAPRDLDLPESITQYAISHATPQEIHDILLLTRPDYTFFDEMRNTQDFMLFSDMRLAGVGMIGVIHATKPIDAIQRFIGRIELGVIPHIIDTVVFIKNGTAQKVFTVEMVVKVPSGMMEADLARPVVVISDFSSEKAEFEIYSYGEETVVIPVTQEKKSPLMELAAKQIEQEFRKYSDIVKAEMLGENKCVVYVPERFISGIIGKQGVHIGKLEEKLGISIDVRDLEEKEKTQNSSSEKKLFEKKRNGNEIHCQVHDQGKAIILQVDPKYTNKTIDLYAGENYVLSVNAGKKGEIKIRKENPLGKKILESLSAGENITLRL